MLSDSNAPAAQHTADRIATEFRPAVDAVVAFWGADWPHHVPVEVAATPEEFAGALRGTGVAASFADVAAVAVATWVDPVRGVADGQRIVFAAGAYDMTDAALRLVLRHELFHFAARATTALDAPLWITEGVADYVARPASPTPSTLDISSTPSTLDISSGAAPPADAEFLGPEPARSQAYDAAWSFTTFLADEFGSAALRQFYVRAAGADHLDARAAAREVFGRELSELVTQWRRGIGS